MVTRSVRASQPAVTSNEAAPLENNANNSSAPSRRAARYRRRGLLWDESSLSRVRKCGRTRHEAQGVTVRLSGTGAAGFAGVITCGSVWAEPVCNAKIMARRALEIGAAVALWQAQGHPVGFLTFTMRHRKGQSLGELWDALQRAWARATTGRGWYRDRALYGVAGWLRVVEVTWGDNGWHVHVHALAFLEGKATPQTVAQLHSSMFSRWSAALGDAGLASPLMVGQDARLVTGPADADLAAYLAKSVDHGDPRLLGLELTQSQSKRARTAHGTVSPWHFLDQVELGDADALDRWHEWEQTSHGRRQITWSRGLRERLGLRREASDEEIAAEEIGTSADDLLVITADGWDLLCRTPARLADVLTTAEQSGLTGLRCLLDTWGVTYRLVG